MALLTAVFGVLVGLALGLTGGGGSIFAIPLLVLGLGMAPREAITLSLAAVTLMAFTGVASGARSQLIEYRAAAIFAVAGLVTAPAGVLLANRLSDATLLGAFAALMLAVAVAMWRKASRAPDSTRVVRASFDSVETVTGGPPCRINPENRSLRLTAPCSAVLSLAGLATGLLSGLFGVGGGFIIVPALTVITQLTIQRAVATSLLVIALIGTSGLVSGIVSGRAFDPTVAGLFIAGGVAGMLAGRGLAGRVTGPTLQKTFAVMMVIVALVVILTRQSW